MPQTQNLTDGEIRYIIRNGVRLTGMPAWSNPHEEQDEESWKLVLVIRDLRQLTPEEKTQQASTANVRALRRLAGLREMPPQVYERWKKTPMANVVRDPREHPEAILPDLSTNTLVKFTKEQIAAGLRQRLEAAILHQNRRRLFSVARAVGRHAARLAPVFRGQRHATGGRRSIRPTT